MTDKRKAAKMDDEAVVAFVGKLIDDAQSYYDARVSPDRVKATDYYHGRPFGNEEDGRSQVVITYVRDVIRRIIPSLLRIFTGPERYVEFKPRHQGAEELAKQQTDYINHIILEDNPGFRVIYNTLKDACTRRYGVIKWFVEEKEDPEETEYTGLEEQQVLALMMQEMSSDGQVQVSGIEEDPLMPGKWKATVSREGAQRRIRVMSVPGDEILWNEDARDIESAEIVTHTRTLQAFKVVALGYDEDKVLAHAGVSVRNTYSQAESDAKRVDGGLQSPTTRPTTSEDGTGDLMDPVRFDESYVYLNYTGKRVQLYKVCTIGDHHALLAEPVPVSHRPFAFFTPDPEPNTLIGLSPADDAMPTQLIQSQLMRGTLDSLSQSIDPMMEVVDGRVSVADLMNTEVGRFVRVEAPNMIREIKTSFAGADALSVMQFMEEVGENATGESKSSVGMDADALQSTAKNAIAAQLTQAQQRKEMIARMFADGMVTLYKGLLRTVIEHQDQARTVRLRGKYVQIDPKAWDANMDVIVNVALGAGLMEDRIAGLIQIAAKQEQILVTQGPTNPLVRPSQYRNTLARIIELLGYKDPAEFFLPIDEQQEQAAMEAAAKEPKPPSPEQVKAQTTMQSAMLQAQTEEKRIQMEMQVRLADIAMRQDAERAKLELERERMMLELQMTERIEGMKHEAAHSREVTKATVAAGKAQSDATTKTAVAELHAQSADKATAGRIAVAEIQADVAREGHDVAEHKTRVDGLAKAHATEVDAEVAREQAAAKARSDALAAQAKGKTE